MKKMIASAAVIFALASCGDQKSTETTTVTTDTPATVMTSTQDLSPTTSTPAVSTTYTPAEGDVSYRSGKVTVYRGNAWVDADNDIKLDSGVVVTRSGQVTRNGETYQMEEGQSMSRVGRWFNKAGEGIDDGWQATKKGVGKAADAVKKAGKKTGEAVKDAVD